MAAARSNDTDNLRVATGSDSGSNIGVGSFVKLRGYVNILDARAWILNILADTGPPISPLVKTECPNISNWKAHVSFQRYLDFGGDIVQTEKRN